MIKNRTYHHPAIMAALRFWRTTSPNGRAAHQAAGTALRHVMDAHYLDNKAAGTVALAALEWEIQRVADNLSQPQHGQGDANHIRRFIGAANSHIAHCHESLGILQDEGIALRAELRDLKTGALRHAIIVECSTCRGFMFDEFLPVVEVEVNGTMEWHHTVFGAVDECPAAEEHEALKDYLAKGQA